MWYQPSILRCCSVHPPELVGLQAASSETVFDRFGVLVGRGNGAASCIDDFKASPAPLALELEC